MSMFGSIMGKIFGHAEAAPAPSAPAGTPAPSSPPASGAPASPAPTPPTSSFNNPASPGTSTSAAPGTSTTSSKTVDVAAVMNDLASKHSEKLDWQHSIVDTMKLLGLDSSLSARKELAKELNYTGSTDDSATMNIWLQKQVFQKLAENGGKVPDDLK